MQKNRLTYADRLESTPPRIGDDTTEDGDDISEEGEQIGEGGSVNGAETERSGGCVQTGVSLGHGTWNDLFSQKETMT